MLVSLRPAAPATSCGLSLVPVRVTAEEGECDVNQLCGWCSSRQLCVDALNPRMHRSRDLSCPEWPEQQVWSCQTSTFSPDSPDGAASAFEQWVQVLEDAADVGLGATAACQGAGAAATGDRPRRLAAGGVPARCPRQGFFWHDGARRLRPHTPGAEMCNGECRMSGWRDAWLTAHESHVGTRAAPLGLTPAIQRISLSCRRSWMLSGYNNCRIRRQTGATGSSRSPSRGRRRLARRSRCGRIGFPITTPCFTL